MEKHMEVLSLDKKHINLDQVLSEVEIFSAIDAARKSFIIENMEFVRVGSQEILMHQGDPADYMYIVYSGRLLAYQDIGKGRQKFLGSITHGELIGEMALISKKPRSASIKAVRQSILIRIANSKLMELLYEDPQLALGISNTLLTRLEQLNKSHAVYNPIQRNILTIAVLSAGEQDVTAPFMEQFLPKLLQHKNVLELTEERLQKYSLENLEDSDSFSLDSISASKALSKLENEYDLIIFNGGSKESKWSAFCIENADSIIFVGDASADYQQNINEQSVFAENSPFDSILKYLVLVHQEDTVFPKSTGKWLKSRKVSSVHHVKLDNEKTLASLARTINNCGIHLVLSGGGAGGYAHIGVIRALRERGIEIDAVCGVSAGAIVGCLFALGCDEDTILKRFNDSVLKIVKSAIFLIQLPLASLLKPKAMKKFSSTLIGDTQIEDLWLNYFCLGCNLNHSTDVIFERGSLADALTASNSLPGTNSPAVIDGELYIDGGATNTMPGDVMKQKYGGITIVVDVTKERGIEFDQRYREFPSSMQILLRWLNPFKKNYKVPLMPQILSRAVILGNKNKILEVKKIADYVIEPDLSETGASDHKKAKLIAEKGYEEAKKQIASWTLPLTAKDK